MELKEVCLRVPDLTRTFTLSTSCLSMMFTRTVYRQDRQRSPRAVMAAAITSFLVWSRGLAVFLGVGAFLVPVLCRCSRVRHDERLKWSEQRAAQGKVVLFAGELTERMSKRSVGCLV